MSDINKEEQSELASLIEFPAEFPIKVMGKNNAEFRALVLKVAGEKISSDKLLRIDEQTSKNSKYLSCTIVAIFENQSEIDSVYQTLTASPLVLMAL